MAGSYRTSRVRRLLLVALAVLAALPVPAAPAHGGRHRTTLSDLEDEVMCPTCGTTLQLADSPLAERQRAFILARVERDETKERIKAALVEEFGEEVLADPPRRGFGVAVSAVPAFGLAIVVVAVLLAVRRWRRAGGSNGGECAESKPLADAETARLDSDLAPPGPGRQR
jgi:cytochrome c-type biogenesis protein CcmH